MYSIRLIHNKENNNFLTNKLCFPSISNFLTDMDVILTFTKAFVCTVLLCWSMGKVYQHGSYKKNCTSKHNFDIISFGWDTHEHNHRHRSQIQKWNLRLSIQGRISNNSLHMNTQKKLSFLQCTIVGFSNKTNHNQRYIFDWHFTILKTIRFSSFYCTGIWLYHWILKPEVENTNLIDVKFLQSLEVIQTAKPVDFKKIFRETNLLHTNRKISHYTSKLLRKVMFVQNQCWCCSLEIVEIFATRSDKLAESLASTKVPC